MRGLYSNNAQYIPSNMHTFRACSVLIPVYFTIFFKITSLALWQSYDQPCTTEIHKFWLKYSHSTKQNKEKQCVYFVGFTVDWFYGMHVFITNYTGLVSWGWVGLWGFFWWAPSAKREDHHGVSSGWSGTWFHSNTGLSRTQNEQIPIIFGVWPVWLTPFLFQSIKFWRVYG